MVNKHDKCVPSLTSFIRIDTMRGCKAEPSYEVRYKGKIDEGVRSSPKGIMMKSEEKRHSIHTHIDVGTNRRRPRGTCGMILFRRRDDAIVNMFEMDDDGKFEPCHMP